jgi:hypothetical protein
MDEDSKKIGTVWTIEDATTTLRYSKETLDELSEIIRLCEENGIFPLRTGELESFEKDLSKKRFINEALLRINPEAQKFVKLVCDQLIKIEERWWGDIYAKICKDNIDLMDKLPSLRGETRRNKLSRIIFGCRDNFAGDHFIYNTVSTPLIVEEIIKMLGKIRRDDDKAKKAYKSAYKVLRTLEKAGCTQLSELSEEEYKKIRDEMYELGYFQGGTAKNGDESRNESHMFLLKDTFSAYERFRNIQ